MNHIEFYNQKGFYSYYQNFYTGTDVQPDILSIFIKSKKGEKQKFINCNTTPLETWMGFCPIVSFFSGAARVVNAVKVIFKELSNLKSLAEDAHRAKLWNAFKNLFRGIVEMIPLTGIVLIIFESIRGAVYCGKIIKEIKEKENIVGVAIDGKIVFTINLSIVDRIIAKDSPKPEKPDEYRLEIFKCYCFSVLEKQEKKGEKIGMSKLFPKLKDFLLQNYETGDQ